MVQNVQSMMVSQQKTTEANLELARTRAIEEFERAKATREIRLALELVKEAARYSSKGNETLRKTVQTAATLVGGNGG